MDSIPYHAYLISSITEVTVTQPFDVIKTWKQTGHPIELNIKKLYVGFTPRLYGNIPSLSMFLFSQHYLDSKLDMSKYYNKLALPFIAGFTQTIVDNPIEVVKINKIMGLKDYNFLRGFFPHFIKNSILIGSVYHSIKFAESYNNSNNFNSNFNGVVGAIGGLIGTYISHPLDTIKTLHQANIDHKKINIKILLSGIHLRGLMNFISFTISLTVFDVIKEIKIPFV
jgi:hypothetical protein